MYKKKMPTKEKTNMDFGFKSLKKCIKGYSFYFCCHLLDCWYKIFLKKEYLQLTKPQRLSGPFDPGSVESPDLNPTVHGFHLAKWRAEKRPKSSSWGHLQLKPDKTSWKQKLSIWQCPFVPDWSQNLHEDFCFHLHSFVHENRETVQKVL